MKKIFIIILVCIIVVSCMFSCTKKNEVNEDVFKKLTANLNEDLANFIIDLHEVEKISATYYSTENRDWIINAINFTRTKRYSGTAWRIVAGSSEKAFVDMIDREYNQYMYLRDVKSVTTPNDIKVDIIHEMATISALLYTNSKSAWELCGYGGDIFQFAVELKGTNLKGTALEEKAKELFLSNSTFPIEDFYADIDAFNIAKIMKDNTKDDEVWYCSFAMAVYYSQDKYVNNRISLFGKNALDLKSKSEYTKNNYFEILTSNTLLKKWGEENNLDINNDEEYIRTAINVFIDEFYKDEV